MKHRKCWKELILKKKSWYEDWGVGWGGGGIHSGWEGGWSEVCLRKVGVLEAWGLFSN